MTRNLSLTTIVGDCLIVGNETRVWNDFATSDDNLCIRKFRLSLGIDGMEIDNECSNNQKRKCDHVVNYNECSGSNLPMSAQKARS